MTRETDPANSYIGDFSGSGTIDLPEDSSNISEADDAIRDAKQMIYNTLPNCTGEVTSTHTELNYLDGVAQPIPTFLKGKTAAGIAQTGGTTTAYTLTTGSSLTIADGMRFTMQLNATCGAAPTLAVDGGTAYDLVDKAGATFGIGDLAANSIIEVIADVTNTVYRVIAGQDVEAVTGPVYSNSSVYNTSGSHIFTVPSGTTRVQIHLIGAGGGSAFSRCGGGAGGGYLTATIPVSGGDSLSISVGAGGNTIPSAGGNTTLTANGVVYTAYGGNEGSTAGPTYAGGTGRSGTAGAGAEAYTVYTGGSGSSAAAASTDGAGGGAAGATGNGSNASGATGGNGSAGAAGGATGVDGTSITTPVAGDTTIEGGGGGGYSAAGGFAGGGMGGDINGGGDGCCLVRY